MSAENMKVCRSIFITGIYYRNLLQEFITGIYYRNLLQEFITGIYYRNLLQEFITGIYYINDFIINLESEQTATKLKQ